MRFFFTIVVLLALAGCATSYNANNVMATRLDENTLKILAIGNAYTNEKITQDYVLLKAAEETKRYGYELFKVINYRNRVVIHTVRREARHSNSGGVPPIIAHYMPKADPDDFETFEIRKPRTYIIIKMLHGEMPENALLNLYSADDVLADLGSKYL